MTQPALASPPAAPPMPSPAPEPPRFFFGDPHIALSDPDLDRKLYHAIANGDFRVIRTQSGRFYALLSVGTRLGQISAAVHLDPIQVEPLAQVTSGQAIPQFEGVCRLAEEVAARLEEAAKEQGVSPLVLSAARVVTCAQFGDQRAIGQIADYGTRAAGGDKAAIRFMRAIAAGADFARDVLNDPTTTGTLFDDLARAVPHAVGAAIGNTLGTNSELLSGQSIHSPNGAVALTLQPDGDLVLRAVHENRMLWHTGTAGKTVHNAWMNWDGNLRLTDPKGAVLWSNGAGGHKDAFARIEQDGNLVVWDGSNHMIWDAGANLTHPNPVPGGHGAAHTDFGGPDIGHAFGDIGDAFANAAKGNFHDFEHFGKDVVSDVKKFGPMILSDVQGLVSLIPGIGTGISAAIGLAEALLEGGGPLEIAIRTAYAAIPIPPGIKNVTDPVVDAALNFAEHPHDFTDVALKTVRDRLPGGLPQEVFDTLVQIVVKKQPILKVAEGLAEHVISNQTDGVAATLAQALPKLSAPLQQVLATIPSQATVFPSIHTIAPHLQIDPARVADLLHAAQVQAPNVPLDPALAQTLVQHATTRVQEQYAKRLALSAAQFAHVAPRMQPPPGAGPIAHLGIEVNEQAQQQRAIASPGLAHLVPTIRL